MPDFFQIAVEKVLKVEGGYTNHSADRGGPTNFGITQKVLEAYRGAPVSAEDVQNMSVDEAKAIYRKNYWDSIRLGDVTKQKIALLLFDQGVNRGPGSAVKGIQAALGVNVDGVMGDKTIAAINAADEVKLGIAYVKLAQIFYANLVQRDNSQAVFLEGWIRRTHKLLDEVLA